MDNMTKIILTDIDNTLLDFTTTFRPWAAAQGFEGTGDIRDTWCFATYFKASPQTVYDLVTRFCDAPEFAQLTPEPHAVEAARALYRAGYDLVGITACADTPNALEHRRKNLEEVFGFEWPVIHICGLDQSKDDLLAKYEPAVWVEDHTRNAMIGAQCGHRTFLVDQPYNRGCFPGVTRVQDWREIAEALLRG